MRTEVFNALPRKEKKILVAKDVIKSIKKGLYKAERGLYCDIIVDVSGEDDVKKNIKEIEKCTVCAIGSAVISITKFANQLTFNDLDHFEKGGKIGKLLTSVFTPKEIALIEACFETGNNVYARNAYEQDMLDEEIEECRRFSEYYAPRETFHNASEEENLLLVIMNIIAKKGRFTIADVKAHNKALSLQEA